MVKWLRALFAASAGVQLAPPAFPAPWASGRRAIAEQLRAIPRMPDGSLPDPARPFDGQPGDYLHASFAAGTLDPAAAPVPGPLARAQAHDLATALHRAANDHTPARFARLQLLLAAATGDGEAILERLARMGAHPARMATLARWLATASPDVAAVRLAIALLGQYGSADDSELLMTLGLHEEFTYLCAVALCKLLPPEPAQMAMWNLARRVKGWGRLHVVRRLESSPCPEIQQWLLRDGYKHSITACPAPRQQARQTPDCRG